MLTKKILLYHQDKVTKLCFLLILFSSLLRRINLPYLNISIHYLLLPIFGISLILFNSEYILPFLRQQKKFLISIGILYLWMWICSIFSPFPITAITYSIKYSVYLILLFAFLLLTYVKNKLFFYYHCILHLLQLIAIFGFVEALFPNLEIFTLLKFPSFYPQIGSIMQNPNQFGVIMVIGLCLTLILAKQNHISQIELYINEFIFIVALALSASRNSWLMFILAIILLYLYRIISIKTSIFIMGFCLFCILFFPVSTYRLGLGNSPIFPIFNLFATNPIETKIASPTSTALSRLKIWQSAISEIVKRPLTGIGIGTFAEHIGIKIFGVKGMHTHNIFLGISTELGITGLMIFMNFLKTLINKIKFTNPMATIPITIFLFSQLFDFFIEDYTFTTIELFCLAAASNCKNQTTANI